MRTRIGLAAALALVVGAATVAADEEKVPLDKLPKAVLDAVKARFPEAKIVSAEKEVENGETEYEVAVEDKGHKIEVTLTPEGVITEIEKQIDAKDLPEKAAKALEAKYPKAAYKVVEEVVKVEKKVEKLAYYEVLLETADKKKLEVQVDVDGKLLKEEDKSKDKEAK